MINKRNKYAYFNGVAVNRIVAFASLLLVFTSCTNTKSKEIQNPKQQVLADTIDHGYNELANPDKRANFTISDYNSDNSIVENIDRPKSSKLKTKLATSLLFNVWTVDPTGPHADFVLNEKWFHVVDYDGDGNMPYELIDNKLKIYYNDFIQEGKIVSVDKDTLKIMWKEFDEVSNYVHWQQFEEE